MVRPFALAFLACGFSDAAFAQAPLIEKFDRAAVTRAATDLHFKVRDQPSPVETIRPAASPHLPPGARLELRSPSGAPLPIAPDRRDLADGLWITSNEGLNFGVMPGDCAMTSGSLICESIVLSSQTRLPEGFNGATFSEVINNKLPIKLLVRGDQLDCQLRILLRGGITPANLRANMKEFAQAAATLKE